jgi:2-isopropylmalate synthase
VLCDTNGGTLPAEVGADHGRGDRRGIPGDRLGIHCHDDTGQAVACSLAAVDAGARQIQGTLNGLGERCGNANLTTLIPTLLLKEPYAEPFRDRRDAAGAASGLAAGSRRLDDILNRVPLRQAPYVGASAFAHKAGLHASAILKDPTHLRACRPRAVGNARVVPMSNQAGQSNLRARLAEAGHRGRKGAIRGWRASWT